MAAVCLAILGCPGPAGPDADDDSPPDLPFEVETPNFTIHSDIELCGGDLAFWSGFIEFAAAYLGTSMPESVDAYVWLVSEFPDQEVCGFVTSGCYRNAEGIVYAEGGVVAHEFVHVLERGYANKDSFFHEGLAEALSGPTQFGQYKPAFPIAGSLGVDYPSAGHFVRWLLERDGLDPFLEHMNSTGGVAEFERIYKGSLDAIVEEFYATADSKYPTLYEFEAPELMLVDSIMGSSNLTFDCARDDVRRSGDGREVIRSLTIESSGYYAFWSSAEGAIRVQLRSVPLLPNDDLGWGALYFLPGQQVAVIPLEPGRYELGIRAAPDVDTGEVVIWRSQANTPVSPESPP